MQCEAKAQEDKDSEFEDPFIVEGLSSSSPNSDAHLPSNANLSQSCTHAARQKQEKLKRALFCAKENRWLEREAEEEEMQS